MEYDNACSSAYICCDVYQEGGEHPYGQQIDGAFISIGDGEGVRGILTE